MYFLESKYHLSTKLKLQALEQNWPEIIFKAIGLEALKKKSVNLNLLGFPKIDSQFKALN